MEYSSQEIQLLTQVLPNIAAQFRTALGNMQAALKTGDDPDSCILRQSYYRLLRIVTNLTDAYMLTEEEPLPKQDTELVEFFDDLCRQAQVPLELCGLTLRADLRPRHLTAGIHREYTTRIFWNLISNAAKFTPAGGEIRVTLTQQGSQILLQVADNGCGIQKELLPHLFDGYLTRDQEEISDQRRNMGIGLSVCKTVVPAHDGTIRGENAPAGGARFVIELPMEEEDHEDKG